MATGAELVGVPLAKLATHPMMDRVLMAEVLAARQAVELLARVQQQVQRSREALADLSAPIPMVVAEAEATGVAEVAVT
jgi:hypothetical protein